MSGAAGEYLDLTRVSQRPIRWAGAISLSALPRLAAAVADSGGQATVELQAIQDNGQVIVHGLVKATLVLT